jgi:hypothetical protein
VLERLEYGHAAAVPRQSGDDLAIHFDQVGVGSGDHGKWIVSGADPIQRYAIPEAT